MPKERVPVPEKETGLDARKPQLPQNEVPIGMMSPHTGHGLELALEPVG